MEGLSKETVPYQINYNFNMSAQTGVNQSMNNEKVDDLNCEGCGNSTSYDYKRMGNSDGANAVELKKCIRSVDVKCEKEPESCLQLNTDVACDLNSGIEEDILTLFPFVCGICDEKFNSLPSYFMHITIHENVSIFLHCCNQFNGCNDTGSIFYSCGICDIKYPTLCTLYEHLLEVEGVGDFVFRTKERTACPFNETSVDSGANYTKIGNNEDPTGLSTETVQCSDILDSYHGYSGNESDTTIIDENFHGKVTDSENENMQMVSKNLKKNNRKVKRKSHKRQTIKVDRNKNKKSVKQKCEGSNFHSRKSESVSPKLAHGNILENVLEKDNDKYWEKKSAHRKKKIEKKDETFSDAVQLASSLLREGGNTDESCDEFDLIDDTVKEGNAKMKRPRMNRKDEMFPCEICGAVFKHQYLKKHRKTHEERTLACDQCENVYNCKFKLKTHKKHVHTDEMKFTCDECGKRFKAWPYLKQHRQVHIKERNIQCPSCPMKFKYAAVLRMHMKTHSDQKPYSCEQCGMKFKRADLLTTHKRYHSDQKTFSCPECSKLFKVKQDVRKHFRIHLPPKFFCEICGKAFVQKYNMRVHMKTHGINP